eukprot:163117-Pelagomonas_calceolata.AAC.1
MHASVQTECFALRSLVGFDCLDADVHSGLREARGYHTIRLTVQNKGEKFLSGLPAKPDEMAATLGKAGLHLQTMYDASGLRNSLLGIAANANEGQKAKQLKLPSFFRCALVASANTFWRYPGQCPSGLSIPGNGHLLSLNERNSQITRCLAMSRDH